MCHCPPAGVVTLCPRFAPAGEGSGSASWTRHGGPVLVRACWGVNNFFLSN
jgi:hypothetical protein